LDHLNTKLKEGDKVAIIPAVGGGWAFFVVREN
jgi:molybdopterin converting factor small subunit